MPFRKIFKEIVSLHHPFHLRYDFVKCLSKGLKRYGVARRVIIRANPCFLSAALWNLLLSAYPLNPRLRFSKVIESFGRPNFPGLRKSCIYLAFADVRYFLLAVTNEAK